ncbi:MAG TPA: type II toxin-antitoxin system RelE/ParE family toxin [Blastocatellia bacterium]|nr:type II toxin-antitoxin system RelE/ParE family toxin [Blastocatellia bacterium]
MAYKIKWSPKAAEDVEAIASYISQDSPAYAAAIVKKILNVTRNLSYFPLSGRVVPEFDEETIREQFTYSYRCTSAGPRAALMEPYETCLAASAACAC